MSFPASPALIDQINLADAQSTWGTNNLTLDRNDNSIAGNAGNFICDVDGASIALVYVGQDVESIVKFYRPDIANQQLNIIFSRRGFVSYPGVNLPVFEKTTMVGYVDSSFAGADLRSDTAKTATMPSVEMPIGEVYQNVGAESAILDWYSNFR